MERIILHIDVNSAFLSWSAIKLLNKGYKKDIREEVSVIAGDPTKRHGVVIAASIPAKKLGIKPPTNLNDARKICKNLIVVEPDFNYYKFKSNQLMMLINKLFDQVEQFSIDECFVDYTKYKEKYGDEVKFSIRMKNYIYKTFGFTVNIGIGNNKLSAKMASDFEKPNKVHTLYQYEFRKKVWPLDISDLFMAGRASVEKLRILGIKTIGDLANYDEEIIVKKLKSLGKVLYNYANGIDLSPVVNQYDLRKSIGYSKTLETNTKNIDTIYEILKEFSIKISKKLEEKELYTTTIKVTIRNSEFKTISHQKKYLNSFRDFEEIYNCAKEIFNDSWDKDSIRLLGVTAAELSENKIHQLSIYDFENSKEPN